MNHALQLINELGINRIAEDAELTAMVLISLCKCKGVPLETVAGMMEATHANHLRFEQRALAEGVVRVAERIVSEAQK